MKNISFLLVLLILLQSCSVYHKPTTLETAVVADKKVRIITTDYQKYKFHRLERENNRLIGITKLESSTAKKLAGSPAIIEGKYLKVDLTHLNIQEINLRNKIGSTGLTILFIGASIAWVYFMTWALSFDSSDYIPDWFPKTE